MTQLLDPRFEGTIRLSDGRRLGFAEFGPATGRALLWFHGTPGARRQIAPEARRLAHEQNVRLISIERPGIGDSTSHAYDAVIDFAADIEELLAALGVTRYGVVGLSGGGPYALACAHEMPERVEAAVILGGVAPAVGADAVEGGVSGLVRFFSPFVHRSSNPIGAVTRRLLQSMEPLADQAMNLFASAMPPGDQRVFEDEAVRRMFQEDMVLGMQNRFEAALRDVVLFGRDWGFELRAIEAPVHLRYGDSDNIVPVEHGEHLAKRIPDSLLYVLPEEGHLGGLGASREIFDSVFSDWSDEGGTDDAGEPEHDWDDIDPVEADPPGSDREAGEPVDDGDGEWSRDE